MIFTALAVVCSSQILLQNPEGTGCLAFAMPFPTEERCLEELNGARQMFHEENKKVPPIRQVEIAHMECVQSQGHRGPAS